MQDLRPVARLEGGEADRGRQVDAGLRRARVRALPARNVSWQSLLPARSLRITGDPFLVAENIQYFPQTSGAGNSIFSVSTESSLLLVYQSESTSVLSRLLWLAAGWIARAGDRFPSEKSAARANHFTRQEVRPGPLHGSWWEAWTSGSTGCRKRHRSDFRPAMTPADLSLMRNKSPSLLFSEAIRTSIRGALKAAPATLRQYWCQREQTT